MWIFFNKILLDVTQNLIQELKWIKAEMNLIGKLWSLTMVSWIGIMRLNHSSEKILIFFSKEKLSLSNICSILNLVCLQIAKEMLKMKTFGGQQGYFYLSILYFKTIHTKTSYIWTDFDSNARCKCKWSVKQCNARQ